MSSPENNNSSSKPLSKETFSEWRNVLDQFFTDKPLKGILQSMDEFFTLSFSDRNIPIEMRELENEYIVLAKLPGIPKQQIDIEIIKQSLVLRVSMNEIYEKKNDTGNIFQRKQSQSSVTRSITFNKPIDEKKIKANHKDGLLEIIVPKIKGKKIQIIE